MVPGNWGGGKNDVTTRVGRTKNGGVNTQEKTRASLSEAPCVESSITVGRVAQDLRCGC